MHGLDWPQPIAKFVRKIFIVVEEIGTASPSEPMPKYFKYRCAIRTWRYCIGHVQKCLYYTSEPDVDLRPVRTPQQDFLHWLTLLHHLFEFHLSQLDVELHWRACGCYIVMPNRFSAVQIEYAEVKMNRCMWVPCSTSKWPIPSRSWAVHINDVLPISSSRLWISLCIQPASQ